MYNTKFEEQKCLTKTKLHQQKTLGLEEKALSVLGTAYSAFGKTELKVRIFARQDWRILISQQSTLANVRLKQL